MPNNTRWLISHFLSAFVIGGQNNFLDSFLEKNQKGVDGQAGIDDSTCMRNTATTTNNGSETMEVAYQVAGENWKRKTFKTDSAFERWLEKMDDKYGLECVELCYSIDN